MSEHEQLTTAQAMLEKAAALVEDGGWPGLAQEIAEMADAVDVAATVPGVGDVQPQRRLPDRPGEAAHAEAEVAPVRLARRAAELHGLPPAQCVAIEDSRWGIESAKRAGLRCVGITQTYPASELPGADRIIDSLDEFTTELIAGL